MMRSEQFDIERMSSPQVPGRKLRLLPGRIYVLRSSSEKELLAYRDALLGVSAQQEHFEISLDGQPWSPRGQQLVGFGESFVREDPRTVYEYLLMKGVPAASIEVLLGSPLLQHLARRRLASLSDEDARMLRLVAVPFGPTNVVVLHDPFEPVSAAVRDLISHTLLEYVWKAQALVLVTKLTTRPGPWIGNDLVVRIELDRRLEPTIGFGSGAARSTLLVQTVRAHAGAAPLPMGSRRHQYALTEGDCVDNSAELLRLVQYGPAQHTVARYRNGVLSEIVRWWAELTDRYATGPESSRIVILGCFFTMILTIGASLLLLTR